MRTALVTLALTTLMICANAHAQGDAESGRALSVTCVGCHGVDGYTNAYPTYRVPKIAGQHAEYLVHALEGYRGEERAHPTMSGQSGGLTGEELRDIAAFLSQGGLEEPAADARAAAVGNPARGEELASDRGCAGCHGPEGMSPEGLRPPSPILAGQYADFLYQAMRQYKRGDRTNAVMVGQAQGLSDRDMRDLAAFYANQPGPLDQIDIR